jgi:DNA-binding NtrC family response regulator
MQERPRLLVVDDQQDVLAALRLALTKEGIEVVIASSPAGALATAAAESFDGALIDLNYARDTTSGAEGLDLLGQLRQHDPILPVVVMTAWATVGVAVEAMRRGARDFIEKPWDKHRLLAVVRNQLDLGRALRRSRQLEMENALLRLDTDAEVVSESTQMREVLATARRAAASSASILITGENGTGKSLLARLIHRWSARAERALIEVNVGAVPDGLFESEMFGHVRGAFTDAREERIGRFELADGGTLFLDEIGNLPPAQQAKLLRVLESGEFEPVGSSRTRKVNVRLIAATNSDPHHLVREGRLRQDLLFRLNTVEICIPPLRERRDDIPALAAASLAAAERRHGGPDHAAERGRRYRLEPEAIDALRQYGWPGNVRELNNVIERAIVLAAGASIGLGDLRLGPPGAASKVQDMSLEDAERTVIRSALKRHAGNAAAAAEDLGLSRSAMYRRMEKLGIGGDA